MLSVSEPAPAPVSLSAFRGRFIRIEMGQVGCLNLGEIMVMSEKNGANLIRPSMVVTTSSSYGNNAYPGTLFVDQKPDTFVHTSCADKGWVMVDLGAMTPIAQIILINRSDCCRQRANGAVLTILNDQREVIFTADPIRNKTGSTTYTEADNSANDRSYRVFTYFPPAKAVIGSDELPATAAASKTSDFDVRISPNQPTKSYQDMKQVCQNKGMKLCRSSDICDKNRRVHMAGLTSAFSNDNWIAVGDKENEWLTLNQADGRYCKTHTEVAGSVPGWGTSTAPGNWERLAKCCPI